MRRLLPAACLLAGCQVGGGDTAGLAVDPGFSGARYTLAFETTRLEDTEAGWAVETDLGYRVEVTGGSLTTYGVSLVACSDVVARSWLDRLSPVAAAHAGHGQEADPSTWSDPVTEDLLTPDPTSYGDLSFSAERYCRVHYLAYAATEGTASALPEDVGSSLRLVGTLTHPDGRTEPLDLSTGSGHGALLDLPADLWQEGTLHVVVRRELSGAFDGIDFATEAEPAWAVLGNLMQVTLEARSE